MKKLTVVIAALFAGYVSQAQQAAMPKEFRYIDTGLLADNAHHWYDILEKDALVHPSPNQSRYASTQLKEVADNVLLYQKSNGGWPKNYDMLAILTAAQKDSLIQSKEATNTTFDNRTTYSQVALLCKVYYSINDERYKNAALHGLDFILKAQYANGGWPQYYPLQNNYSRHITFNDDAMGGIMHLLKDILDAKPQYSFIDDARMKKVKQAFETGVDCILKMQIVQNGRPTAWCQQHDEITLQPAWARKFEPPCITSAESCKVVYLLMSINNPSPQIKQSIEDAVAWMSKSKILYTRVQTVKAPAVNFTFHSSSNDKVVVTDSVAPPIWTRYYELGTNRPLFCNRDSKTVYSLAEVERERRTGYAWYSYEPQKLLEYYEQWKKKWKAE
ncbi:MAG TPA: pectate lyase [Phnomibacter sp.]|nr:pectate lyase [Phnomibacter sp.]